MHANDLRLHVLKAAEVFGNMDHPEDNETAEVLDVVSEVLRDFEMSIDEWLEERIKKVSSEVSA